MNIISVDLDSEFLLLPSDQLIRLSELVNISMGSLAKPLSDKKLDFDLLKDYYNVVFAKRMRVVTDLTKKNLNKRIREGYTKEDIRKVIDNASNDKFHEPNDFIHVSLEFLSTAKIFSRYVSEKEHQIPRNKKLLQQQGHTNH